MKSSSAKPNTAGRQASNDDHAPKAPRATTLICRFARREGVELMEIQNDDGHDGANLNDNQEQRKERIRNLQFRELVNKNHVALSMEIGNHSVIPSTRPMSSAFKASISTGAKPSAFMCIYATVEFYMTSAHSSMQSTRIALEKQNQRRLLWQTVRKSKKRHPSSSGPKSCL